MVDQFRIEYVLYRNEDFKQLAFASSEDEKERLVEGLKKLKHVSMITVIDLSEDHSPSVREKVD